MIPCRLPESTGRARVSSSLGRFTITRPVPSRPRALSCVLFLFLAVCYCHQLSLEVLERYGVMPWLVTLLSSSLLLLSLHLVPRLTTPIHVLHTYSGPRIVHSPPILVPS